MSRFSDLLRRPRRFMTVVAAALTVGAIAPAAALAYIDSLCCYQIASGQSQAGGVERSNTSYQGAESRGTAYSGVWLARTDYTRVSAIKYCESPGCRAGQALPGLTGRTVMHNHGNASTSGFSGDLQYG